MLKGAKISHRHLVSHLFRRAGFGVSERDIGKYLYKSYEDIVDELIGAGDFIDFEDDDILERYYGEKNIYTVPARNIYRMINTKNPLQEKIALFWHHLLATGYSKDSVPWSSDHQINLFRRFGLTDFKTILVKISKDPAMISWLDNNENHAGEPNENYGRELLELFSMGVGNYTEEDVKNCAYSFTGWTFTQLIPLYPTGHYLPDFEFLSHEHEYSMKKFLGHCGRFNGEDVIDIIVKQPATARFLCRHLYNFFVADEKQVPAWNTEPPIDSSAINELEHAYFESNGDIRHIIKTLFNSDFFKKSLYKKVKSPTELIVGVIKLVETYRFPEMGLTDLVYAGTYMGQQLINPPTVEGWHTGMEWIDGGTLSERINFVTEQFVDTQKPGIKFMLEKLSLNSGNSQSNYLLDQCLEIVGLIDVKNETREGILSDFILMEKSFFGDKDSDEFKVNRVARMLQLVLSTREYQLC